MEDDTGDSLGEVKFIISKPDEHPTDDEKVCRGIKDTDFLEKYETKLKKEKCCENLAPHFDKNFLRNEAMGQIDDGRRFVFCGTGFTCRKEAEKPASSEQLKCPPFF